MRERILMATALTAMLCAPVRAQSVSFDYDRSADFGRFRTYAWVSGTTLADELNHKRVVAAVNRQMAAKGLTEVASIDQADVAVAYHASFDKNVRVTGFASGFGYRFGGSRTGVADVENIVQGTLMVDVIDAKSRSVVWRGIASKEVDVNADPDKRDRNINRAAEKLFKHYPPGK